MKRRIGLPGILAVLCFTGIASAQTAFVAPNGQLTAGVSTRADVDKTLGAPTKQESTTLFDYKPPSGAASLQIYYRADGVVSYINAAFSQAYPRNDLVQGLGLPAQAQQTKVVQNRLREYFGAPAYLVFTYVSQQSSSGVINLRYDSADAFAAEAPGTTLPPASPPANNAPPPPQPLVPAAPPNNAPPLTPLNFNGGAAPAMWQKELAAANRDWSLCGGAAAKALASLGYEVHAGRDVQGRQRAFSGVGTNRTTATINCTSTGATAVSVVTSTSVGGKGDAQNIVNRLVAALASPAPGNGPPVSNQEPVTAMPGMAQQQEEVANQPWAACPQRAQQTLNGAGYQVTNTIDGQGFESNVYGVGNGKSAVIGCAQVGMNVIYTITTASMNGERDADAEATRLHDAIFAARPGQ